MEVKVVEYREKIRTANTVNTIQNSAIVPPKKNLYGFRALRLRNASYSGLKQRYKKCRNF